jgi:hypothetical protein
MKQSVKTGAEGKETATVGADAWDGAVILIALSGYLLLAHGCHADKDNELFAPRVSTAVIQGEQR